MQKSTSKLTVFFDDPFWVAFYECFSEGELEVCKITFGAEPRDCEVYEYFLNNFNSLTFSPPMKTDGKREQRINPKRMQREVSRQLETRGVGTKSQQALKLQQEQGKTERKQKAKQRKEEKAKLKFELRQMKQKEKHRDQ